MKPKKMKSIGYLALITALIVIALVIGFQYLPGQGSVPGPETIPPFRVTFLDVGQGDCAVVQAEGNTLLIDAGGNATADRVVNSLKGLGIRKVEAAIGTHPHEDHIGGLDKVINQFDIGQIYMPAVSASTETFEDVLQAIKNKGISITAPFPGTTFSVGPVQCTILSPNSPSYEEINNYSIVIRVLYGAHSFLFAGDTEDIAEKEMLAKGYSLESDVLKVGHHGSTSSTTEQFLKAVSPDFAVISAGQGNDYGHPHRATLDKLDASGIKVYRTDLNGTITFTLDGAALVARTEK